MIKQRAKIITGSSVAISLVLALSSVAQAADGESSGEYIRLAVNTDQIDTLNPFTATFEQARSVLNMYYEPLAGIVESGEFGGYLAEDFSVEGTVWTYRIRENARWSDGTDLTSEDVLWTYEAVMNDPAMQIADGQVVANVVRVSALDDYTVEIETDEPSPLHPGRLPIVPKHIWEDIEDPAGFANTEEVVGSGPFVLTEYKTGVSLILEANEHHWRGKPEAAGIHMVGFKNYDAMVLALRNGEIDILGGMNAAHYESLADVEGVSRFRALSKHFWYINFNQGQTTTSGEKYGKNHAALEDVEFRQALVQAIDRETLLRKVINGLGTHGPTILPPGTPGGMYTDLEGHARPFDLDAAKQKLEDAGYRTDAQGNRLDKEGKPIELRLMYDGNTTVNNAQAEFIAGWWGELGIQTKLNATNWDEIIDKVEVETDYDTFITGWSVPQDPDYILSINTCATLPSEIGGDAATMSGMCDPEFDKVFQAQRTELDADKRTELVHEALKIVYDYAVLNVFYYGDNLGAYRSDRLGNLVEITGSPYNVISLAQATITADAPSSPESQNWMWVAGISVLGVVILGATVFIVRKKKTADTRE